MRWILLFVIFAGANIVATIVGFGGVLLSLTLAAFLFPLHQLIPIFVALQLLLSVYLVCRYFRKINHREFWKKILPFCLLGGILGWFGYSHLQGEWLAKIFALFIIAISLGELREKYLRKEGKKGEPLWGGVGWLIGGGLFQGLYGSGGPLVVYYLSEVVAEKGVFRSTMALLWVLIDSCLVLGYLWSGTFDQASGKLTLFLLPALILGILAGEWIHHRLSTEAFQKGVYWLLLVGGMLLLIG